MLRAPRHGRRFEDFELGAIYAHPWEVTIDEGMLAFFAASFQDAIPTFASRVAAARLGFRDRPVHPLLLLNLGLSFSVQDVSEQAIANLAYIDVRFPAPCYAGDTVRATSRVLGLKPVSSGDKGVVHVRTELTNQDGVVCCAFERKALVRGGHPSALRSSPPEAPEDSVASDASRLPEPLRGPIAKAQKGAGFATFWEDLDAGDVIAHAVGRTVSQAEHMQLTTLIRNSHPLHFDEGYCRTGSFAKTRVVFGGLVLAWALSLTSRDTAGNALWDMGLDAGAHPSGVLAGDTIYAATKVVSKEPFGDHAGKVTLRVVGLKNTPALGLLEAGVDLFAPELGKTSGKIPEKVVEITRTLLVRRRG